MSDSPGQPLSFPRHRARTRNFTLGRPRNVTVADDGSRVVFLRSVSGTDPVNALWVLDVEHGKERQVAEPATLLTTGDDDVPPEERARRERMREIAGGIVGYDVDTGATQAVFALGGRLFRADLVTGDAVELPVAGPVIDPRLDPTGSRVGYVTGSALHVVESDGSQGRPVIGEDSDDVTWGVAEFVAAEEMDRSRGYWWAPDGQQLLVARVDESPVRRWHIADPAHPEQPATETRYPTAGTPNAVVTVAIVGLDGARVDVAWDADALPYLATAGWPADRPPYVVAQSRDQRTVCLLEVDPGSGATRAIAEETSTTWVDLHPRLPAWLADGRLVGLAEHEDTTTLTVDGEAATPTGLQVTAVSGVGDDWVLLEASEEPTERHLYRWSASAGLERLTTAPGMYRGTIGGDVVAVETATLDAPGTTWTISRGGTEVARLTSYADTPSIRATPRLIRTGSRELRTAVVLPRDDVRPDGPLPVLMAPYGGPHFRMVTTAHNLYLEPQWFADQGFAVVIADGRGTGGRGPAWDRAVHLDLAGPVLEDQVDALRAAAEQLPGELDLGRVGISGWSFGGYLAALAVLRRPDVFHAAVAGAPVTDWTLYDTHYTERYLGDPTADPDVYRRSSLLDDAPGLRRPLMLIHGLADDNVAVAHTLGLSSALLAAGRPHTVLPLSGVTHMATQEAVAENLLLLQVEFLRSALADPQDPPGTPA
ncbi:MAG TPA: prolyl oligopeptidase family serine peptidase [Nocardioides sp.]|uniref:S9 family peptidase n=1 Tax=Nocardioides sp. TaxID=35761 RepID=UPI002F3F2F3B